MAQSGEFGTRPDRTENKARDAVGARSDLVGDLPGELGALEGQLPDAVGDVVVAEVREVATERVGLDRIRACLEIGSVDLPQDVRTGVVEDLVATLESKEIVQCQVRCLQHCSHGTVTDQDAFVHRGEQFGIE